MNPRDTRNKFLDFFKAKNHVIVPSSSLIPDDPSVLLTTAGMQQFKPYFIGKADPEKDFGSKNTVSVQKCFRTSDIDEVGDESHLTFFEMLGNFSFGGYFKEKAIEYGKEFITSKDWMSLEIDKVTVFDPAKVPAGDWRKDVPFDQGSYTIWKKYVPESKIEREGIDNFWGPTGTEGPCGPTTEIYIKNSGGQSIEIWNIVFNEFYRDPNNKLTKLETPGVDTGMGLERLTMVSENLATIFDTDLFQPIISVLPTSWTDAKVKRILADHARGTVFLVSGGVRPSNKDQGYILRKLIRRSIAHLYLKQRTSFSGEDTLPMGEWSDFLEMIRKTVEIYGLIYKEINGETVLAVLDDERKRFGNAYQNGLREMKKMKVIDAISAFKLYESHGLPYEVVKELGGDKAKNLKREAFEDEFRRHQEKSRAGAEKKFGGHGLILDTGELKAADEKELKKVTRLHTATHMLQQALREVLGSEVRQAGSDITAERTRFDFTFQRKLTLEEIKKVEDLVNKKIQENLPMQKKIMPKAEAEKTGALYFFREKYPDLVNVYFIGNDLETAWSKEFCGGPHVGRTSEIGAFKIIKEEAVGAGTRRIRATVFP